MTPHSFTEQILVELRARDAEMPFDSAFQIVKSTWGPDGCKSTPREVVDFWMTMRFAASMTHVQWLSATDPQPMLARIRFFGLTTELTLFGCACCRRIWDLLPDDCFRLAVESLEKYLHKEISESDLKAQFEKAYFAYSPLARACREAWYAGGRDDPSFHSREMAIRCSAGAAVVDMDEHGYHAAVSASTSAARARAGAIAGLDWDAERLAQTILLREFVRNPLATGM